MSTSKDSYKISVLIINYNSEKHAIKLLKSLELISNYISEILIVDNCSGENFKVNQSNKIRIIKNSKNLGFAKAVNQGIKIAKNNIILLVNPDTYLENNSIINSIKLIYSDKKIAAIGGKIKNQISNKYEQSANSKVNFFIAIFEFTNLKKLFPNNYFSKKFWIKTTQEKPIEVESVCGAFIILRKKIKNELNLFNEDYFLYLEDIDFGNKINSLGYKVIYDPNSEIAHVGGSSNNSKYKTVLKYWYNSRKIYFNNFLSPVESLIINTFFSIEEFMLKTYHFITHTPNA
jgi:hypothetical protein